jgi:glycosyltransferase involved in cell wall biosynthesis
MKIALITSFYFPITGGPSSDTFNLARTLTDLGHEVCVYTPISITRPYLDEGDIRVIRYPTDGSLRSKAVYLLTHPTPKGLIKAKMRDHEYPTLSNILKRRDHDVVHSRGIWCHALETNPQKGVVTVMTFGTMPIDRRGFFYRKLVNYSISEIDHRVAVWKGMVEGLWSLWGIKVDKVINNGVDTSLFSPLRRGNEDDFVIGTVLKFAYRGKIQGLGIILLAFARLCKVKRNVRLKIVGDGPLREEVEYYVNRLPPDTKGRVSLLGELSFYEMPTFYNTLDLYAHISFQDAAPNSVLEAMSCGLPIMGNGIGFIPELLREDSGWIVPASVDAVYHQLVLISDTDKQILVKKGERARDRIKSDFCCRRTALEYLKLYQARRV